MNNVFYTLGYNPILIILFCCSNCFTFGSGKLFQLALMSPWHTYIFFGELPYFHVLQDGPDSACVFPVWETKTTWWGDHEKKRALGFHKAPSGVRVPGHIPDHPVVSELDSEREQAGDVLSGPTALVREKTFRNHNRTLVFSSVFLSILSKPLCLVSF